MISTHSRSSQLRTALLRTPRQGFSLIEVAIALVIFVIGALAIIRIFPGALSVIGNNGNQQVATNLNRTMLAKLRSENSVPDATFNLAVVSGDNLKWTTTNSVNHSVDFANLDAAVIGVPRFNASLPTPEDINTGANNSALSRFRAIQGEKTKVIKLTDSSGGEDIYVLTQFPISVETQATTVTPLAPVISRDIDLANIRIKPDGKFDFSRASRADDPTNAAISPALFTPQSLLYVTYRYRDSSNKVWGVEQEAVVLPPGTVTPVDFAAIQVNPPTSGRGAAVANGVVPEIVNARLRRFVRAGEFGVVGATDFEKVADARRGIIRVTDPALTDPELIEGTPVSIDYVADWSFLLKTGTALIVPASVSAPAPATAPTGTEYRQIALGTPFIEDQTQTGIYSLLVDPTDKKAYRSSFGQSNLTTSGDFLNKYLLPPSEDDLRAGRVTFITPRSDTEIRVSYQTRDKWVQQLSVAAMAYKPYVQTNAEPWRDYYLGTDDYLYFRAGEAGKTISLSYSYNDVTDDAAATPLPDKVIVDRPFAIDSQLITAPAAVVTAGFATTGDQISRIQLQTAKGENFPATKRGVTINLTSIQAVKGASVTARTAYVNGTKYAQKLDTTTRGAK